MRRAWGSWRKSFHQCPWSARGAWRHLHAGNGPELPRARWAEGAEMLVLASSPRPSARTLVARLNVSHLADSGHRTCTVVDPESATSGQSQPRRGPVIQPARPCECDVAFATQPTQLTIDSIDVSSWLFCRCLPQPSQHFLNFFPEPQGQGSLRPTVREALQIAAGRGGGTNCVTRSLNCWS